MGSSDEANYKRIQHLLQQAEPRATQSLSSSERPYRLVRQDNRGAHAALNYGISLAQGEYIAILNSDDRYHPQRVSIMVNALQESGRRFAYSQVRHIGDGGLPTLIILIIGSYWRKQNSFL